MNCIRDKLGGSKEHKESDVGYHTLFAVSNIATWRKNKLNRLFFKPGETRRTAADTVQTIKRQIYLACGGVACRVSELQTETGVKDRTAQHWIECALERSSELMRKRTSEPATQDPRLKEKLIPDERKRIKEVIRSETSLEVYHWVVRQPQERYDALPQDSRKCRPSQFLQF